MIRIQGARIRQLREQQQLTQLYLATSVDVTTETISRWERTASPTIKKENGIRLAEALDVSLESITVPDTEAEQTKTEDISEPKAKTDPSMLWLLRGVPVALLIIISTLYWFRQHPQTQSPAPPIPVAIRILPAHTIPGQPFPVLIKIDTENKNASLGSYLVKETLPGGVKLADTVPVAATINDRIIKWIQKDGHSPQIFAYMGVLAETGDKENRNKEYHFSGSLLLRQGKQQDIPLTGNSNISSQPFHWADRNSDQKISDDEILAVYDDFNQVKALTVDMELIEEIWMGSGYTWNQANKQFTIIP